MSHAILCQGVCAHHGCSEPVHQATTDVSNPANFCSSHATSRREELQNIDRNLAFASKSAKSTHYQCAAPNCSNALLGDAQFYPVCSQSCRTMHNRLQHSSSLIDALPLMGQVHQELSIVDASWATYTTGDYSSVPNIISLCFYQLQKSKR